VPEVIIIAGPNGAGKTTFAREYRLTRAGAEHLVFVNADEIARELAHSSLTQEQVDVRAVRNMLEWIDDLAAARADFMFETTLATLTYARKIALWRKAGYYISLIYLRLRSVQESIARVRRRAESGGHYVPEAIIRRRFDKSAGYFEATYKAIVDEWYVWDSLEGRFVFACSWDQR
jgi:predicted ABC-type ATPase